MAKHLETGKKGEQLALDHLRAKGYQILECNWRYCRAEVDIIAKIEEVIVFIEVKTRSGAAFGPPEAFLSAHQEKRIADAAAAYLEKIDHQWEIRFDIISIILKDPQSQIKHFEDAFFPSW